MRAILFYIADDLKYFRLILAEMVAVEVFLLVE